MDLPSRLWPPLVKLPLAKMVQVHYEFMVKNSKLCLSSLSKNYSQFLKYMYNDNANVRDKQPSLGMQSESFSFLCFFGGIFGYFYN